SVRQYLSVAAGGLSETDAGSGMRQKTAVHLGRAAGGGPGQSARVGTRLGDGVRGGGRCGAAGDGAGGGAVGRAGEDWHRGLWLRYGGRPTQADRLSGSPILLAGGVLSEQSGGAHEALTACAPGTRGHTRNGPCVPAARSRPHCVRVV